MLHIVFNICSQVAILLPTRMQIGELDDPSSNIIYTPLFRNPGSPMFVVYSVFQTCVKLSMSHVLPYRYTNTVTVRIARIHVILSILLEKPRPCVEF